LKALPGFFLCIFSQLVTISKKWKNPGSTFHIGEGPANFSFIRTSLVFLAHTHIE
jgi:hypothetical protein